MGMMAVIIGATGISFLSIIGWVAANVAAKKKEARINLEKMKLERERSFRQEIKKQKQQEHQERLFKAEVGHIPSQLYLAKEAERSDPKEALRWYEKAAVQDNELAMYGVIRVCSRAKNNPALKQKYVFWKTAIEAHNGSQVAKLEMGKLLIGGTGTEINVQKGIRVIEEVAEQGYSEAQVYMGDWHIAGCNMEPKPKLASEWYFRAAEQNHIAAQIKLGINYRAGTGVKRSVKRATYWFEIAAERGSAEGQYYAGDIWIGRGEKGNAVAYLWLYLSAHFGYQAAKSKRDDVANLLGIVTVLTLQKMAKPLAKKLSQGPITKHSLISALNRIYERPSYFPDRDGSEFMVPEKGKVELLEYAGESENTHHDEPNEVTAALPLIPSGHETNPQNQHSSEPADRHYRGQVIDQHPGHNSLSVECK